MNTSPQNGNLAIPAMIIGLAVTLYVAASILLDEGNQLAGLFFYLLVVSAVIGVIAPRMAFVLLILQCGYLDLLKRLMVIGGRVAFSDLFSVLGIAPVTVVCIAFGLLLSILFGRQKADDGDIRRLLLAVALNTALGLYIYFRLKGGASGTMREVANGSIFSLLVFIAPLLNSTQESVAKCVRLVIFVFVPVAAYGIYQQMVGYQDFEIDYLKTGLSIEVKQLEYGRLRAFSTLNSATSLSVVCNSLAALVIATSFTRRRIAGMRFNPIIAVLMVAIFIGGWLASTARAGITLLPVAIVGGMLFQTPRGVRTFYGTLIGIYILMVAVSPLIYANIFHWTDTLVQMGGGGEFISNLLNLNSYVDRLQGFMNILLNPNAYTLFGVGSWEDRDNSMRGHDPISEALVTYGVIPLVIGLVVITVCLKRVHRLVLDIQDPDRKAVAAAFLANSIGNIAVSVVNGNLLGTFPVNVFFWLPIGWTIALLRADMAERDKSARATPVPEVLKQPSPLPSRDPGAKRFRPVRIQ